MTPDLLRAVQRRLAAVARQWRWRVDPVLGADSSRDAGSGWQPGPDWHRQPAPWLEDEPWTEEPAGDPDHPADDPALAAAASGPRSAGGPDDYWARADSVGADWADTDWMDVDWTGEDWKGEDSADEGGRGGGGRGAGGRGVRGRGVGGADNGWAVGHRAHERRPDDASSPRHQVDELVPGRPRSDPAGPPGRAVAGDTGRGGARALIAVLLVGAVLAGWWWWQGRPRAVAEAPAVLAVGQPVTGLPASTPAVSAVGSDPAGGTAVPGPAPSLATSGPGAVGGSGATGPTGAGATVPPEVLVVVHVVGTVRHPGVVRLPAGARVIDAVEAAGGLRSGAVLGPVNLARLLVDGEQVVIGPKAASAGSVASTSPATGPTAVAPSGSTGDTRVNLNTASLAELEELPRVGPVLAQRIIDWREEHGGFRAIEELGEVSGIGDATFAGLAPLVTI